MTNKKRTQIESLSNQVRIALKLTTPITYDNLKKSLELMGGTVRLESDSRLKNKASIQKIAKSFEIVLDASKPEKHILFLLAHNLGHLFIHMGFGNKAKWNMECDYVESYIRNKYDEEEFQSNEFATALLMPKAEFRSCSKNGMSISKIAEHFGVSDKSADARAKLLNLVCSS